VLLLALFSCSDTETSLVESLDSAGDSGSLVETGETGDTGEIPPCTPLAAVEGGWLEAWVSGSLLECEGALHAVAGPESAELELYLSEWTGVEAAQVRFLTVGGEELWAGTMMWGATETLTLPWNGEFLVELRGQGDEPGDYTLEQTCIRDCAGTWTRYPTLLMHGLAGTESFVGILDYWYGVEPRLTGEGYTVWVRDVDPYQSTTVRAEQWAAHLEELFADGHHRHVNLLGHSQGGLDARYVTSLLDVEGRVATVTTVSTPHRGTGVADIANGVFDSSMVSELVADGVIDALMLFYGSTNDQDIAAQMAQMSAEGMETFNNQVSDRSDVMYQSWAGRTCGGLDLICQWDNGGEIVTPLFAVTHGVLVLMEGDNDGLVGVESAKWGDYRGEISADHIDEIGQIAGATAPGFDHLDFYSEMLADLSGKGF
jgi:triacylglycerol esterase/lipase EstA (alpha/beta hydrolase family)